jgi:Carboxypeptidase regulatory-like domain
MLAAVAVICFIAYQIKQTGSQSLPTSASQANVGASPALAKPAGLSAVYPQISLKNRTKQEAVRIWLDRLRQDSNADWKTPIEFFGRVVDESSKPIANARIHFQWTDLSIKGTTDTNAVSNDQGLFHLSGVEGKRLSVRVEKDGYYPSESASFRSFEFSNPGEDIYYEPDKTDPIIFRLRKKGEGAKLVKKSIKVILPNFGSSATVDLIKGAITPAGQLEMRSWKPWPPKPISPHYDWKVELTIPNGGFVDAPEEFAFEAPENGYSPSFAIDMPASRGNNWSVSAEKTLYFSFDEPKKYGRLNFRTDGDSRYVFINYVLNPTGSRNLEEAPDTKRNEGGK